MLAQFKIREGLFWGGQGFFKNESTKEEDMKRTSESQKRMLVMALAVMGLFLFQSSLMAEGPILSRTGTLQVTNPDGTVSVIGPTEALPSIASGSKVEVVNGSIEIAPSTGFIQLVIGGSVATVKAGDSVTATLDPATGKADFQVKKGQVKIVSGNTTTTLAAGQHALIALDKVAGIATVESIAGNIETVTVGVKSTVSQGCTGQMSADPKTRNVHVESVQCRVTVVAIDGTVTNLDTRGVIDTPGAAIGEIQTFEEGANATIPHIEEARQPLRIEGSPFTAV